MMQKLKIIQTVQQIHDYYLPFEIIKERIINNLITKDFVPNNYLFFENIVKARTWGDENYNTWANSIIEDDKKKRTLELGAFTTYRAFREICGWTFITINRFLRKEVPAIGKHESNIIKMIDKEFDNIYPLSANIIVIRKITSHCFINNYCQNNKIRKNLILFDEAYKSTSLSLNYNHNEHGEKIIKNHGDCFLIIKIPKGKKCLYINHLSDRDDEQEILLPRTTKLRVEKNLYNNYISKNRIVLCSVL